MQSIVPRLSAGFYGLCALSLVISACSSSSDTSGDPGVIQPRETPRPTPVASVDPTPVGTADPTPDATRNPSAVPSPDPSVDPTADPTVDPSADPTPDVSPDPSDDPTPDPSADPSPDPSDDPTPDPSDDPTPDPSADPTPDPTPDINACREDNPDGNCPAGEVCDRGLCIDATLCSPANPVGTCPDPLRCQGGRCEDPRCSENNPTGECPEGRRCDGGTCIEARVSLSQLTIKRDSGVTPASSNGIADAGENFDLELRIENRSQLSFTALTGELVSLDTDIAELRDDGSRFYDDLPRGTQANPPTDFQLRALAGGGGLARFELRLRDDIEGEVDVLRFALAVRGPLELSVRNPQIDDDMQGGSLGDGDGTMESGERVELGFDLFNDGELSFPLAAVPGDETGLDFDGAQWVILDLRSLDGRTSVRGSTAPRVNRALAPGQTLALAAVYEVDVNFSVNRDETLRFAMDLGIEVDGETRYRHSQSFSMLAGRPPQPECQPDARRCGEDGVSDQVCDSRGFWGDPQPCGAGRVCAGLRCTECDSNTRRCTTGGFQLCEVPGFWGDETPCPEGQFCSGNEARCVECNVGERRCDNNGRVRICESDGRWSSPQDCGDDFCRLGHCVQCTPGEMQCADASSEQVCGDDGLWEPAQACASGTCENGSCPGFCPRCVADSDCGANESCERDRSGSYVAFCRQSCGPFGDCPDGYTCRNVPGTDSENPEQRCYPESVTCPECEANEPEFCDGVNIVACENQRWTEFSCPDVQACWEGACVDPVCRSCQSDDDCPGHFDVIGIPIPGGVACRRLARNTSARYCVYGCSLFNCPSSSNHTFSCELDPDNPILIRNCVPSGGCN